MRLAKILARQALHGAGLIRVAQYVNRDALRIIMYHRFPQEGALESHCQHIARYYTPVPMQAVARWLAGATRLPRDPVAVTVDDGYRCFRDIAHPIFAKYKIPVTAYLATDFIDGILWFWDDQVRYSFLHTSRSRVEFPLHGGEPMRFVLDSPESRLRAAFQVNEAAKLLPEDERKTFVQDVFKRLDARVPVEPPEDCTPLTWDDARGLARQGVEFGAHSKSHAILSRLGSESAVLTEVEGSQRRIEAELQAPVTHFCYPNGRSCDIDSVAVSVVRSTGFRTGVTACAGLNRLGTDPLLLRRIAAGPETPVYHLAECLAGFHS